jgi:hypothetical protein
VKRWRGVRGEGATLTSAQNHQPNQHGTATQPPPHPRTTVHGSPANPPLAPVQRGRDVRGEGAALTNITTSHSPFTGRTDLRLQTPSYKNSCPFVFIRGSKTSPAKSLQDRSQAAKPELQKFVPIRVHSWFKKHPPRRPCRTDLGLQSPTYKNSCPFVSIRGSKNIPREDPAGQISGCKPRPTKIRVHSCSFVVQKHPPRSPCRPDLGRETPPNKNSCPFVYIRGSKNTPREDPAGQISDWKPRATKIRVHSCSFVVQKTPPAKSLQNRSQAANPDLQKFVSIRVHSWFKNTRREDPSAQISGCKPRATNIRAHSCSFVVQKTSPAKTRQDRSLAGKPELQRGPPADSRPRLAPRHPTPDTARYPSTFRNVCNRPCSSNFDDVNSSSAATLSTLTCASTSCTCSSRRRRQISSTKN